MYSQWGDASFGRCYYRLKWLEEIMSIKIAIIVGSTRQQRSGRHVADWFYEKVKNTDGAEFEIVDLKDINLPMFDEPESPASGNYTLQSTKDWGEIVEKYDGYVWVTPEYNDGPPASLKNAIDSVYNEWGKKPVAFVGYGSTGGATSIQQLTVWAAKINMVPILGSTIKLKEPWFSVGKDGKVNEEYVSGNTDVVAKKLLWWAKLLKAAPKN